MDSSVIVPAIATIIGGLIVYFGSRMVNNANANAVDIKTFRELVRDVQELNEKVVRFESKNAVLWQYVYSLLEHIRRSGGVPPPPPIELETDPNLVRIIKDISDKAVG